MFECKSKSAAPDFGAELLQDLLGGEVVGGRRLTPLGARHEAGRGVAAGVLGGEEEEGVGGDGEGGADCTDAGQRTWAWPTPTCSVVGAGEP
jgi:hypothetical protein